MVLFGPVRYDLRMLAWKLRSSAAAAGVVLVMLSLGGCGTAFTNADASDAAAMDSGDAGLVDGASVDGNAPSYCASVTTTYVFCDDFDDNGRTGGGATTVQGKWTNLTIGGPGSNATVDSLAANPPSPPNTFNAQVSEPDSNDTQDLAVLTERVGQLGVSRRMTTTFSAFVTSYGSGDGSTGTDVATVFNIMLGSYSYALFIFDPTRAYFTETGPADDGGTTTITHPLTTGLPLTMWTNVSVSFVAPTLAASGHVTIAVGSVMDALDMDLMIRGQVDISGTTASIGLGVYTSVAPWGVRFDNVLFTTE